MQIDYFEMPQHGQHVDVLVRSGGMGDVLMLLSAAKAIKAATGAWLLLITEPANRDIAKACVHVDHVVCGYAETESVREIMARPDTSVWQLGSPSYSIARRHQVDAYLETFGIVATSAQKELELIIPPKAVAQANALVATFPTLAQGRARILIHPGSGDPNRTWPQERWIQLAQRLIGEGHQVVRIGAGRSGDARWVQEVPVPAIVDAAHCLGPLATVALMRQADLLVSTDGGPVQLAAASDIGIVGLYSVVPGRERLPFRHGQPMWHASAVEPICPSFPCYHLMHSLSVMEPYIKALQAGKLNGSRLFSHWCLEEESFRCMRREIGVPQVIEACRRVLLES